MKYINIGKIINTHGIKGECKIQSYSDFDDIRYKKGNTVYILFDNTYIPCIVQTYRKHKGFPLVSFEQLQDINMVEKYKNCNVYITKQDQTTLPKGQYYRSELIGLQVFDSEGNRLGTVISVEEIKGAQNNLRIEKEDGTQFLVPYIPSFILKVNLDENSLTIRMDEGLL